jgi:fibronectin-binding autotransporter adhesin
MKSRSGILAALFVVSSICAHAQTVSWNLLTSGDWSNSSSWFGDAGPITGSYVTYQGLAAGTSVVDETVAISGLETTNLLVGPLTITSTGGNYISLQSGATISQGSIFALNLNVPIEGAGNLAADGGIGVVKLNPGTGSNTYSGSTVIAGGDTLADGEANSYSPNSVMYVGGTGGGTLDVNHNETIAGLNDGGSNGSVVIAGAATLDLVGGYSGTFSGVISGAGSFEKDVTGTLTLVGANTYTGTTVINGAGGTAIALGNGGTTGSIASSGVSGTGTLEFDRSNAYAYSGALSGALQVAQTGSGTTTLSGSNSYTGATRITAGVLQAGSNTAFGGNTVVGLTSTGTLATNGYDVSVDSVNGTSSTTLSLGGGELNMTDTSSTSTISGTISGTGSVDTNNYQTVISGNNNSYSGGTTIAGGTLVAENTSGSATGTGPITIMPGGALLLGQDNTTGYISAGAAITDNGALQFFRTDVTPNVISNNISGSGTIDQDANGVTELSGTNSYTGTTTILQGTLEAGSTTAFGNLSQISFTDDGTLALNGFNVTVGSIVGTPASGGINLGANTLTIAESVTDPIFSGTISGTGNLTIGGSSTGVILTGSNTYSGTTNVNAGLLLVANPTGYGTGTGPINIGAPATLQIGANSTAGAINPTSSITDDGTLAFSLTGSSTIQNQVSGTGGVTLLASGTIALTNANTYSGLTQVENGTLVADNASGSATGTGNISISGGAALQIGNADAAGSVTAPIILDNGTVEFARTDNITVTSAISGTGGVTVQESGGSVTLEGANSYSGPTVISSGELEDWDATSLSANSSVQIGPGGSLAINDNETIADLENIGGAGGPVYLAPGTTLTIGTGNAALAPFMGTISGPGGITINTGSNSQGFGGQNTYTGVTTMDSGEIFVSSSTVGAPGSITSGPIGTNTLVFAGNGEMSSIANDVTLANAISLGGYNLDNDDATTNLTLSGPISGVGGSITWCTDNVLALTNSNSFTGGVDMREGTLLLGSDTGAGVGGTITLDIGTVLDAAGTGVSRNIANPINVSNAYTTIGTNSNNNITISGPISGSETTIYVQAGPTGSLTLTNANTGLTSAQFNVDSGTVVAANNNAFGFSGNSVYLDGGAALTVNSGITITNPIVTLSSPNTIGGSGTISSPAITADGTVILSPTASPGGGPGNLTFTNSLTLASGVAIQFDIYDATGAAGTGYGLITAAGGLNLTAGANTITFNLVSTNSTGGAAAAINFNAGVPYSWTFASSSSAITGFNPNQFNLVSNFINSTGGGTFSFTESGNNLDLNFTPVPEPSTWAMIGLGVLGMAAVGLRKRRSARA